MKHIDTEAIRSSADARLAFLTDFCLFAEGDWAALDESLPYLAPSLPELLDRLYEHLLAYDDTRRVFLGERGEVDPKYIELRKEHMTEWIMSTLSLKDPKKFAEFVMRVGKRHTGVTGEEGRAVPPRYMVALISFIQTSITSALVESGCQDQAALLRMIVAWNKMLMVQLEMFLKVIAPHWPHWDEA